MSIGPKLKGDLGQRYEVRQFFEGYRWRSVGWTNHRLEAEQLVRQFKNDEDVISIKIVDRQREPV